MLTAPVVAVAGSRPWSMVGGGSGSSGSPWSMVMVTNIKVEGPNSNSTARQISEKVQNSSVHRQPVRCPLARKGD